MEAAITREVWTYPDDESLGCGGAIALLRQRGIRVTIAVIAHGRASHPNSKLFPSSVLIELRRQEALEAASALGVDQNEVQFLQIEDSQAHKLSPRQKAVLIERLRAHATGVKTVLTPWRLDPHCDHRATFSYTLTAVGERAVRILEYPIWLWQNGASGDGPSRAEFATLRLDVSTVLQPKLAAVSAHRSQLSDLIWDDPNGFRLPAQALAQSQQPWELFFCRK